MKIALFIPDFTAGGAERIFATLAKEFALRGHDVDLVIGNQDKAAFLHLIPPQVRVIDLKAPRMRQAFFSLVQYFRREKPDIALATRLHSSCFVVLARMFSGVKTAVVLREASTISLDMKKYPTKKRLILSFFAKLLYPYADAIVCVSQGAVNDLHKFIRIHDEKVYLVYNPVLTEDVYLGAAKDCEHPWFQNGTPVILSVGRLSPEKKFDTLIEAFSKVRQRRKARLLILGEGPQRAQLQSLVSSLNLKDDIDLPGFDGNPFKYMSRAKLYVLSSAFEGLPGALIQALACGCPVVSTDCPSGPREVLKFGQLGKLVPVGDPATMATAIEEAMDSQPIQVKEEDLQEYTVANAINSYLRIFNAVKKV